MARIETEIQNDIQHEASRLGNRLWRNHVGLAWHGQKIAEYQDGSIVLKNPRRVRCGLAEGSGDLIGGTVVTITPEMVGTQLLVFTSVEAKQGRGTLRKMQAKWRDAIVKLGGIALVARSVADYKAGVCKDGVHKDGVR